MWFYKEIESVAKGEVQQNMDQYEIAKKIQLGTISKKFKSLLKFQKKIF